MQTSSLLRVGKTGETDAQKDMGMRKIRAVCWFPFSVLRIEL